MASGDTPRISEKAVQKATGYSWSHWFTLLDEFDVPSKGHTEAAKFLAEVHGLDAWWAQSVSIEYEVLRGLRLANQKTDRSFSVSVQRTVEAPAAWVWPAVLNVPGWLPAASIDAVLGGEYRGLGGGYGVVKQLKPGALLRLSFAEAGDPVESMLYIELTEKSGRTAVRFRHERLSGPAQVETMRGRWTEALERFSTYFEKL